VAADSGNGASWELDISRWLFINPELTVHLHRDPVGEWVCLDAETAITSGGAGLATCRLFEPPARWASPPSPSSSRRRAEAARVGWNPSGLTMHGAGGSLVA
ncbi:MAG: hypothetical protein WBE95_04680, partial [Trebonia sp.]